jgi:hypothetical protein
MYKFSENKLAFQNVTSLRNGSTCEAGLRHLIPRQFLIVRANCIEAQSNLANQNGEAYLDTSAKLGTLALST